MRIEEILQIVDINERIQQLKNGRSKKLPDVEASKQEWNAHLHKTMTDKAYLSNRLVKKGNETIEQDVNRIAVPLQKKIVNTAVSFAFGLPVIYNSEPDGDVQTKIFEALKKITKDCKLNSFSRRSYRELLRATEVAELWYYVDKKENSDYYGFSSKLRVRCSLFSPYAGDILYPFFDERGDLVTFSREFKRFSDKKEITYFETYTDTSHILWKQDGGQWVEEKTTTHNIGKIPVVYASQETVEWYDVQICIDRLELLLSRFAETIDYHASPMIFFKGKLLSMPEKGDSGKVLNGDKESEAHYLSWDHAPDAVKLEIETLLRFIYSMTQTPDISFDSVKGLSAVSGVALEMLFIDAHLKVQEKKEILDEYLQRRVNIQKRMIGKIGGMEKEAEILEVEPEIVPFKINDETTTITNLITATGNKAIMSRETAVKILNATSDTAEELERIKEEEDATVNQDIFEPAE